MNEQEFQSQATPTAFQLYYNRIRSVFASPLFLALTIAVTCMAFFQLIATMSNGVGIATLMNLLYLAMETLTAIGCWLTWYQARSNADAPTHLGMTRCCFCRHFHFLSAQYLARKLYRHLSYKSRKGCRTCTFFLILIRAYSAHARELTRIITVGKARARKET